MLLRDEDIFEYHEKPRPGKLEVVTTKPCLTQRDLSMAYSPGVARPCLAIEENLRKTMSIPVFHDDQHGTAIISSAALLNALELVGKRLEDVRIVFSGAGAAGIACANMYLAMGVKREHVLFVDTVGVIYEG